jgi:seryl-tRNA synthetase
MSKAMPLNALMLGWVIVAAGTAVTSADDEKTSAAEKVLNGKGLTRDDRMFLLDEAAAVEKYGQAKAGYADYQKALNRYAAIVQYDEAVQTLETERQALQQQVNTLQMQINNTGSGYGRMRQMVNAQLAPLRQQQSQDRAMMNQINAQIQASKGQAPKAADRKTVPAEAERTRQAFVDSVHELSEILTPLLAKYHELALDKAVTDALVQLRHSTTLNYKLGPSDQIVAASKLIHEGKKHATGKSKPASKKKAKSNNDRKGG